MSPDSRKKRDGGPVEQLQRSLDRERAKSARHVAALTSARAQQAAASEILGLISSSPTDVQPVFDAIVSRAAQLCEAEFSAVARLEDGLLHLAALNNMS